MTDRGAATIVMTMLALSVAGGVAADGQQPGRPHVLPSAPRPGLEHALFTHDEGTWDAVIEIFTAPDEPPMISKGVETNVVGCGGLCLISDLQGTLARGTPFHGHGMSRWDSAKQKYIGCWTDSLSRGFSISEGVWDPEARVLIGSLQGPDMTGAVLRSRTTVEYKGGSRVLTMYDAKGSGDALTMRITYTRRN